MKRRYFGMTMGQLIVLIVLGLMACTLASIAGSMALTMSTNPQPVAQSTYTLAPSQTPAPTSTPLPTITAIPNWQPYSFDNAQAVIWLPAGYTGADTTTSSETVMQKLRGSTKDEAFINGTQELIALPEVKFFAFDTDFSAGARFMYVGAEALTPDVTSTMDDYLNIMMDNFTGGGERIVERQVIQLDRYPAGKLVVENKVPTGEGEAFVTSVIHFIKVGDTMWFISFRTGREEYKNYLPVIESSVNSFWAQP